MRTVILFLLFLSASFANAQHDFDGTCKDLSHIIDMEMHGHEKTLNFRSNVLTENYDLKYHRLYWEVDPAVNYINGEVTSYFTPSEDGFSQINFDFADNMTVQEISYHGNALAFTKANDNLQINLPATVPLGQLDSITVKYEGAPNSIGFGSFEISTHNGTPILWTLSEPYGAKVWWPCKQDLNDKIDSTDIFVRTPAAYRVGSNGKLVGETEDSGHKVYHWKHRYPIAAYLVAIAVTDYAVFSDYVDLDNGGSIEILNYVFPENLSDAQTQLASTVEIMGFYNDMFGVYPFANEKYGHAQFGWGGGMEHQTMSFMGGFSYGLQAHELAHQWFGDKVTCGTWQDIWLNEGFATYLTGLTSEFLGTAAEWQNWKSGRITNITSQPGGSVWVDDTTSVNRIFSGRLTYNKGAYLLHMLRWKLGDEDFFQAVQNYLNDPALAYGYAKTADLQAHLEAQSGQALTGFFDDWFYGQGFPSYQVVWEQGSQGEVYIQLGQTTSHPSVGFFEMPVPVLLKGAGVDSLVRLEHTQNGELFSMNMPFEVTSVQFDPDLWLISANNTVQQGELVATGDVFAEGKLFVYPNPAQEFLQVFYENDKMEAGLNWLIVNNLGQRIKSGTLEKGGASIAVSGLLPGLYRLVLLSGEGSTAVRSFVKK